MPAGYFLAASAGRRFPARLQPRQGFRVCRTWQRSLDTGRPGGRVPASRLRGRGTGERRGNAPASTATARPVRCRSAERPEGAPDLLDERHGLLERREVAALVQLVPVAQVRELPPGAWAREFTRL